MSGTSVDGVDWVLAELNGRPPQLQWKVVAQQAEPFPAELRQGLLAALRSEVQTRELALLHHQLGRFLAQVCTPLRGEVDLAAMHGQTVWHEPPAATLQIGEASYLAEALQCPVVSDFRPADLALGGEAAPLVPYPDLLLYGQAERRLAIHNIGGISNLTYLPGLNPKGVIAFDTGPGNCLIDEAAQRLGHDFDPAGSLGERGQVDQSKLSAWLQHPYFVRQPPKSTGREIWNLKALETEGLRPYDLLATLTALTAQTIVKAYQDFVIPLGIDEVWVAGGGAYNRQLMQQLRASLSVPVLTFEERGYDAKAREPLAFAVLGYLRFLGLPNVLPQVTGATRSAIAGKLSLPGQS